MIENTHYRPKEINKVRSNTHLISDNYINKTKSNKNLNKCNIYNKYKVTE